MYLIYITHQTIKPPFLCDHLLKRASARNIVRVWITLYVIFCVLGRRYIISLIFQAYAELETNTPGTIRGTRNLSIFYLLTSYTDACTFLFIYFHIVTYHFLSFCLFYFFCLDIFAELKRKKYIFCLGLTYALGGKKVVIEDPNGLVANIRSFTW